MYKLLKRLAIWGDPNEEARKELTRPEAPLELPWRTPAELQPMHGPGPDFQKWRCAESRRRARAIARATLGEETWNDLQRCGYLDLPSKKVPGLTYRLRVGHRVEVRCTRWARSPWPMQRYICLIPAYTLPEEEFFAHLYLYVRDREEAVLRLAVPQSHDQSVTHTF